MSVRPAREHTAPVRDFVARVASASDAMPFDEACISG
jgi:hypothetical protein